MSNKLILSEINAILDNLDIAGSRRGHTLSAKDNKPNNGKVLSSWVKNLYNKLKSIADKYRYSSNPILEVPVKELEPGYKVYEKLIETAKDISADIEHNITCNSCTSNCVSVSTVGTTWAVHHNTQGEQTKH